MWGWAGVCLLYQMPMCLFIHHPTDGLQLLKLNLPRAWLVFSEPVTHAAPVPHCQVIIQPLCSGILFSMSPPGPSTVPSSVSQPTSSSNTPLLLLCWRPFVTLTWTMESVLYQLLVKSSRTGNPKYATLA